MPANKSLKVTLVRSKNGRLPRHLACLHGLGLRRINQSVQLQDTPAVRGIINKVSYMVKVEDVA